jgi:hypothetical protein
VKPKSSEEADMAFEKQMQVASQIMIKDREILRALAKFDRDGQFTLNGKVYGPKEIAEITSAVKKRAAD